ncbi:MAG: hypothetical protein ACM30E_05070, partial [Nitrososphaerales archaeon]
TGFHNGLSTGQRRPTLCRRGLGLDFDAWSLQRLRSQLIEHGVMGDVSAETIRQELLRNGLVFEERRWVSAHR